MSSYLTHFPREDRCVSRYMRIGKIIHKLCKKIYNFTHPLTIQHFPRTVTPQIVQIVSIIHAYAEDFSISHNNQSAMHTFASPRPLEQRSFLTTMIFERRKEGKKESTEEKSTISIPRLSRYPHMYVISVVKISFPFLHASPLHSVHLVAIIVR